MFDKRDGNGYERRGHKDDRGYRELFGMTVSGSTEQSTHRRGLRMILTPYASVNAEDDPKPPTTAIVPNMRSQLMTPM